MCYNNLPTFVCVWLLIQSMQALKVNPAHPQNLLNYGRYLLNHLHDVRAHGEESLVEGGGGERDEVWTIEKVHPDVLQ